MVSHIATDDEAIAAVVRRSLKHTMRHQTEEFREKTASIFLIFYPVHQRPYILFTKRSLNLAEHKGEISFPGGRRAPEDGSLLQTAVREVIEEINVKVKPHQVLGKLKNVMVGRSGYLISPFVVHLPNRPKIEANSEEISEIIEASVSELMNPSTFKIEIRMFQGAASEFYSYRLGRYDIWGATARILKQFLDIINESEYALHH